MRISNEQRDIAGLIARLIFHLAVLLGMYAGVIYGLYWLTFLGGFNTWQGVAIGAACYAAICHQVFHEQPTLSLKDKWKHLGYFVSAILLTMGLAVTSLALFIVGIIRVDLMYHHKHMASNHNEYVIGLIWLFMVCLYRPINIFYKNSQIASASTCPSCGTKEEKPTSEQRHCLGCGADWHVEVLNKETLWGFVKRVFVSVGNKKR